MLWSLKIRIKKLNPRKTEIKRGGGEKEKSREERGHSTDPPAALSHRDSRSGTGNGEDGRAGMGKVGEQE